MSPYTVLCVETHYSCSHPSLQVLPDSIACRLYVITVLVETTIDLIIEGDLLLRFHKAGNVSSSSQSGDITSEKMPVFLSVFALAQYVRPPMVFFYSALIRYPQRLPVGYGTRCRVRSEYPAVFRAHVSLARYLPVKKCISETSPFSLIF